MHSILSILAIILGLLLIVGVHEVGHALAARWCGVKIKRISLGFGRPLFRWSSQNQVEWVFAMWPLGGYVQLLNSRIAPVKSTEDHTCFDKKLIWMRVFILLAGCVINFIIAWLAFVLYFSIGFQQITPVISSVTPMSAAYEAGLHSGDRILSIDGYKTDSWRDVGMQLIMNIGQKNVSLDVLDASQQPKKATLNLTKGFSMSNEGGLLASIGMTPDVSSSTRHEVVSHSLMDSMASATLSLWQLLVFFMVVLKQLVVGAIPFSVLLGPLGMFNEMIESFFAGMSVFLYFIASLSFAVGLINLFPIPGLDGGSILYQVIEKIRGKPMSVALEVLLHRLAFIVFCVLLVQLLANDLERYFIKGY